YETVVRSYGPNDEGLPSGCRFQIVKPDIYLCWSIFPRRDKYIGPRTTQRTAEVDFDFGVVALLVCRNIQHRYAVSVSSVSRCCYRGNFFAPCAREWNYCVPFRHRTSEKDFRVGVIRGQVRFRTSDEHEF